MSVVADPYGLNGGPVTGDPWGIQKRLAEQADAQRIANDMNNIIKANPLIGLNESNALNAVSVVAPVAHNIPWIPIAGVAGVLLILMIMSR